jgi:hypothetical protein
MGTLWQSKLPMKLKTFMWLVDQDNNSIRDSLIKENEWKGDPNCIICGKLENA